MKTIKIDEVEISVDQIKKAMKENPELFKESKMPWRAEKGGDYFCVADTTNLKKHTDNRERRDEFRYSVGNCFATKDEAHTSLARQIATGKVRLAILEANDGWVIDWSDDDTDKFWIEHSHDKDCFGFKVDSNSGWQSPNMLPFIKSDEIAEQIIKDYKPELKLIFNVK